MRHDYDVDRLLEYDMEVVANHNEGMANDWLCLELNLNKYYCYGSQYDIMFDHRNC